MSAISPDWKDGMPGDAQALLADALSQSQATTESEKAALARTLHDDMGGLLVGALMDIGWISRQPGQSDAVREKLERAAGLLRAAVEIKRNLIENLRPSLLDNVGLYATLRWHLRASCEAVALAPVESFPATELALNQDLKIGVFRIFQEVLKRVLADGVVKNLSFTVSSTGDTLTCKLVSENKRQRDAASSGEDRGIFLNNRVSHLGGTIKWTQGPAGHDFELNLPYTPAPP